MSQSRNSNPGFSGSTAHAPSHLLVVMHLWACHVTSLGLSFLICKVENNVQLVRLSWGLNEHTDGGRVACLEQRLAPEVTHEWQRKLVCHYRWPWINLFLLETLTSASQLLPQHHVSQTLSPLSRVTATDCLVSLLFQLLLFHILHVQAPEISALIFSIISVRVHARMPKWYLGIL